MKTTRPQEPALFLPFARSYWVVPGRLLAGFFPGDRDPAVGRGKLSALLDCGVTHIVNLMRETDADHAGRRFAPYEREFLRLAGERGVSASWRRHPVRDLGVPTAPEMAATLDAVDEAVASGGCVYVHCWGGRGRTGTVVGCWLARHGEADPLGRLRALTAPAREHFPQVPETSEQRNFVRRWRVGQ